MAHQSFAKKVCDAVRQAADANGEVSASDLSCLLYLQTRKDHKRMLNTLSELSRRGKIARIRQGVYGPVIATGNPDKREVMWRVLRMRRVVTIADLEELAGVSPAYAKEWLELLVRRDVAIRVVPANQNHPHSWRLINNDPAAMPIDEDKAARLRDLRKRKKKNIKNIEGLLDAAGAALDDVRKIVKTMEDGE